MINIRKSLNLLQEITVAKALAKAQPQIYKSFGNVFGKVFENFWKDPDMNTTQSELKRKEELNNKKLAKVKEDLLRKQCCIICAEINSAATKAKSSCVTKSLLTELKHVNVCPVMLVQFLVMCFFQLDDGEYSELHHLSNCKYQVENS